MRVGPDGLVRTLGASEAELSREKLLGSMRGAGAAIARGASDIDLEDGRTNVAERFGVGAGLGWRSRPGR